MVEYKKIIVPADGSENGKRALEHALAIVKRNDAELILVHEQTLYLQFLILTKLQSVVVMYLNKLLKIWKKQVKKILSEVAEEVPADMKVKCVFEVGSPGPAVLAVAKKYDADLIVMGSRGLGPLKGLFMGSVSSYVTSHSTCPVLIVK